MLQKLHSTASSSFAKILLFLLIASFALWGIGDMFRSSGANMVVKVGDDGVRAIDYQRRLAQEQGMFRRMMGDNYSPELVKSLGIPEKVLQELIERTLLAEEAKAMELTAPEEYLHEKIRENPAFHNESGVFDRAVFQHTLNNFYQMTEKQFAEAMETDLGNALLAAALFSAKKVSDEVSRYATMHQQESRRVNLLVLKPSLIKQVRDPSDAELTSYYETHSNDFKAQEHRVFSLLVLDPNKLKAKFKPTDEDVLFEYQENQDLYRSPEQRDVMQLIFETREAAEEAAERIEKGENFASVAKELGATNDNFEMNGMTKNAGLPAGEEEVFSLQEGEVSTPVESSFGWHVFKITKVSPEQVRPLAEVKDKLSEELQMRMAEEEAYALSNQFQDLLAGGASMDETAKELNLEVKTFGPISAEGTSPDGTKVELPAYDDLMRNVFAAQEGDEPTVEETSSGLFYAVRVDSVMPERTRALDEIRGTVISEWKTQEKKQQLRELAEKAAPELENVTAKELAASLGAEYHARQEINRQTARAGDVNLPPMFVRQAFAILEGESTAAHQNADGTYVIGRVVRIDTPELDSTKSNIQIADMKRQLTEQQQNELLNAYLNHLRNKHGVSNVNQKLFELLNE